jgi:hypothetical protein
LNAHATLGIIKRSFALPLTVLAESIDGKVLRIAIVAIGFHYALTHF